MDGEDDVPGQIGMLSTGSYDAFKGPEEMRQRLLDALSRIATSVSDFLKMYAKTFRVDFTIEGSIESNEGIAQ